MEVQVQFFLPFASNEAQQKSVYSDIKVFVGKACGATISDLKIFSISYVHDGKEYYAEVGKTHSLNREPVLAILYEVMRDLYYIITPTRGYIRDMPILAGAHNVRSKQLFDD